MNEEVRHFSLRKLSVGLASVLIGVSIFGTSQTVKADTVENSQASTVTNNAQSNDTQENGKPAKSSFSDNEQDNNVKSNLIQTQVEGKKDQKQDSVPKTQEANNSGDLDAEKDIVSTSSLQKSDNQSNDQPEGNSQTQPQNSQKLNLTKNSKKFAKKVLATNLIATSPMTNGGFDEATWGKLDVTKWQGAVQDGMYQLTGYTGDLSHIIVPNEADFEQAGKSTNGLQVGITKATVRSLLLRNNQEQTIAFSKTNNEKVKAIGTDWSQAFSVDTSSLNLSKFDGSSLDVSSVTNMHGMFYGNSISDLTSLAHWDTSNVTNMSYMFYNNKVSDLTSLANWNTSKVTDMSWMFYGDSISDLTPLANWDTSKVTDMSRMFSYNKVSNLTSLANWDTSNVTDMSRMFSGNSISDLTPLAKWDTSKVTSMNYMFGYNKVGNLTPLAHWDTSNVTDMSWMFSGNKVSDLTPLANWNTSNVTNMSVMFSNNSINDLTPLAKWNTSNVTDMGGMFSGNKVSDLTPLAKWNTSNVTDMGGMFSGNKVSDLTPLAHWDTNNITDMNGMFSGNSVSDLTPLAHWDTSKVTDMSNIFASNPDLSDLKSIANWNISGTSLFKYDTKLNLTNVNNTPLMQGFLKTPKALQGATFITNNADLVKATIDQDLPDSTNTAKRTITFNLPHAEPKTITQTIYYKDTAPAVQINFDYDSPQIVQTYPLKNSDWQLDTSKQNDAIIVNGQVHFKAVKIPHVNGYKAHLVRNKLNPASFMVSFIAVPSENKPSTPVEVVPSKPSAPADKPFAELNHKVVDALNQSDSGWTMPETNSTYTVEVPADDVINLSDLVIAEPVHAQTTTQIHVTKRFKLSKKHSIKHLKHRKKAVRQFKKYRL